MVPRCLRRATLDTPVLAARIPQVLSLGLKRFSSLRYGRISAGAEKRGDERNEALHREPPQLRRERAPQILRRVKREEGAWLALEAASMADDWRAAADPGMIATDLTDTEFGHAWIVVWQ